MAAAVHARTDIDSMLADWCCRDGFIVWIGATDNPVPLMQQARLVCSKIGG
jgi:hypothetical protein